MHIRTAKRARVMMRMKWIVEDDVYMGGVGVRMCWCEDVQECARMLGFL